MTKRSGKLLRSALPILTMCAMVGCRHSVAPPITPPKDPREYSFTIDTLVPPEIPQTIMLSIWGTSSNNLYVVGHNAGFGRSMYHYDGKAWAGVNLKISEGGTVPNIGTLNNIFGFTADNIYAVGDRIYHQPDSPWTPTDSSLIVHFNGASWTQIQSLPGRAIVGVWGYRSNDIWAGGTNGTLFHYDGVRWKKVTDFPEEIWFARFTGFSSNDVSALCYSIPDSANLWHRYYTYHWDGSNWKLVDSFVENQNARFGSQAVQTIDGELYSAGLGIFKMLAGTWTRIHYEPSDMGFLSVRGTSSANIFGSGGNGLLVHFNGVDWYRYHRFDGLNWSFNDVWTDGQEIFVVADDGLRTYVIHGQ